MNLTVPSPRLAPLLVLPVVALVACGEAGEPAADAAESDQATIVRSFEAMNESGMMGSLMVAPGGEELTVKVEVLGVQEGREYPTRLQTGSCGEGGEAVLDLEPLTVNSLGIGSSSTSVPRDDLGSGTHSVRVHQPDGTAAACADLS